MAVAGVIMVLAWVPYIEITSFKPLGFDIKQGGELSVWGILAVVLVYYACRFGVDCWTDYSGWRDEHRKALTIPPGTPRSEHVFNRHARRLNRRFWAWDVTPPVLMFLFALVATVQQVAPLILPPDSPPPL